MESGTYSNEALVQKNEAVLAQTKASDQWAYFQAKSIKATVYSSQAAALKSINPDLAESDQKEAARYAKEEDEISHAAKELEQQVQERGELAEKSMEHHHRFAYAVTMFQISIALSAIAALSRQKTAWYAGILISLIALLYFADGFWLFF